MQRSEVNKMRMVGLRELVCSHKIADDWTIEFHEASIVYKSKNRKFTIKLSSEYDVFVDVRKSKTEIQSELTHCLSLSEVWATAKQRLIKYGGLNAIL